MGFLGNNVPALVDAFIHFILGRSLIEYLLYFHIVLTIGNIVILYPTALSYNYGVKLFYVVISVFC